VPPAPRPSTLHRWRWLLPVAALLALFHFTPAGTTLDWAFHDFAARHPARPTPIPADSALVLIDDATMATLGREPYARRWPFPRTDFAALFLALHQAGATRVVADLTFLENSEAAEQDMILAATAAACPSVVLARMTTQPPVFWDETFTQEHAAFFPTPRTGIAELDAKHSGVLRAYQVPGSLAAAACAKPPESAGGLLRWAGGLEQLRARGVPVLSAAPFLLHGLPLLTRLVEQAPDYTPEQISAALAREPALDGPLADAVRGRVVFVGANASGTFDAKPLPIGDAVEPGVITHWTAWANLQTGGFVTAVPRHLAFATALVIAALVGLARWRQGLLAPTLAALALALLSMAGTYLALSAGWFFPPSSLAAAALFALLAITAENFLAEQQRKREVQAMFGSYVAPEVVELLVNDPHAIQLGGERRELTSLFSDLAGFTDLSEKIPPEHLVGVINLYLQEVSDSLLATGAYIDKYIGDAVMAVYGAPLVLPDHAEAACRGALAAQEALGRLAPRLLRDYGCSVHMRIGVNTGDMIVGNVGSDRKKNYTVLGDAVNLSSRLEGANKEFGTAILLGETTARRVQGRFVTRPLTRLRVKGKTEAIEVHELVGLPGQLPAQLAEFVSTYNAGYAALLARDWSAAATAFEHATALAPSDRMAKAWQESAHEYRLQPPPLNWQPLLKLDSK